MRHQHKVVLWYVIFIAFVALFFSGLYLYVEDRDNAETNNKAEWFHKHDCKTVGYVAQGSRPTRIYRCDDGGIYIWQDIPAQETFKGRPGKSPTSNSMDFSRRAS